jgi:hypothetical protein
VRTRLLVSLTFGVFVACSMPTSVCGCTSPPPSAIVVGTMWASAGRPLRGGIIRVRQILGTCPGRAAALDEGSGASQSDSTGRYRTFIRGNNVDTVCVHVVAYRSVSAQTDSLVSLPATLALKLGRNLDSARIDFRFP